MGITESWRSKRFNRRCIFCVFIKKSSISNTTKTYQEYKCLCKDKEVIPGIPRLFCSCFQINKKECEEIDKALYTN